MTAFRRFAMGLAGIVACASLASCDVQDDSAPVLGTDNTHLAAGGAEFRFAARQVYQPCQRPLMNAPGGRSTEAEDLRELQDLPSGDVLRFQIGVVLADLEFAGDHCLADDEPEVARRRLAAARENWVRDVVALAGDRAIRLPGRAPTDPLSPEKGAIFRARITPLVESVTPSCQLTARGDDDAILEPARRALDAFEQRLRGTPYALHFDIAEADVLFLRSITVTECAAPDPADPGTMSARREAEMTARIATIENEFGLR